MNITKLINIALDSERYSDEYKSAWRSLFKLAQATAKQYPNRDIDAKHIVDAWLAYHQTDLVHCNPDDDAVCGDESCMQAMRKQQRDFLNDIRNQYIVALRQSNTKSNTLKQRKEFLNIAKRLRKLWNEENATNIQSVPFELYEEMPDSVVYDNVEDIDDTERYVYRQESRTTFYQEPECDPNDSHYVGDTTRLNRKKSRGNIGLLNGLYEQTDPEPTYQTPESRRCMLRQLRTSDSPQDIEMYFALTTPTRRNESDEQWSTKVQKRRRLRNEYIKRLS